MFIEEKIEWLKRSFSSVDFQVPYMQAASILKSIEREFIVAKDLNKDLNNLSQNQNHWPDNIKSIIKIKSIDMWDYTQWLAKLDSNTNYWTVLTGGRLSATKHRVYDCKPNALNSLYFLTRNDFFIVDKKYNWFTYFEIDKDNNTATIYKGGQGLTPFES
jgi:hypothetical protein